MTADAIFGAVNTMYAATPTLLLAGLVFALVVGLLGGFFPARLARRAGCRSCTRSDDRVSGLTSPAGTGG
jgi:hypothetical protein